VKLSAPAEQLALAQARAVSLAEQLMENQRTIAQLTEQVLRDANRNSSASGAQ
jgi:hypothetical protein